MEDVNPVLLKRLEETCGGSCVHDPDTCECFGIMDKEVMDDLGLAPEENNPDDAFYKKEHCAFYDSEHHYIVGPENRIKNILNIELDRYFSLELKNDLINMAIKKHRSGEDWVKSISFAYAMNKASIDIEKDEKRKQYIYLLHTEHSIKIGMSYNPKKRTNCLSTKSQFKVIKTDIFEVENMAKTEAMLHRKYKDFRTNGEWFKLTIKHINEITNLLGES